MKSLPNINLLGWVPTINKTKRATLLCTFHCSIARAISKPPRRRILVSFMYCMHTSLAFITPRRGKITSGNNDVTASGVTSVIQNTAIMKIAYAHLVSYYKQLEVIIYFALRG